MIAVRVDVPQASARDDAIGVEGLDAAHDLDGPVADRRDDLSVDDGGGHAEARAAGEDAFGGHGEAELAEVADVDSAPDAGDRVRGPAGAW